MGWFAALICYPPLRQFAIGVFEENPFILRFDIPAVDAVVAGLWALLFGVYLWATLALNVRASNLTNRGIVGWGPYRYVRHPEYAAKNFAWWLGALTIVIASPTFELSTAIGIAVATVAWTAIYYLRAVTEERHLGRDPDYQDYCSRTRYRFIPGVI